MADVERRVASTDDAAGDSFLRQGGDLLAAGRLAEAREALERAYALQPKDPRAQNLLGLACFKLGIFDRAAEVYEQLVRDNPVDPTLRVNLGLVHLRLNALERATREFETAVDLAPDHKKAQNYLGLAYAQACEYARARDCFVAAGSASMVEKMEQAMREAEAARAAAEAPESEQAEPAPAFVEEPTAVEIAAEDESLVSDSDEAIAGEQEVSSPGLSLSEKIREVAQQSVAYAPQPVAEAVATEFDATADEIEDVVIEASADVDGFDTSEGAPAEEPTPIDPVPAVTDDAMTGGAEESAADEGAAPGVAAQPAVEIETIVSASAPTLIGTEEPPVGAAATLPLVEVTRALAVDAGRGSAAFEVDREAVRVRVEGSMVTRLEGLMAAYGALRYAPELKRFRGKATDKPFGDGERRMVRASGTGRLLIDPRKQTFLAVELGGESAFFREEYVFAFEPSIEFENGRVPSKVAPDLHLVHLRGRGNVLVSAPASIRALEVELGTPCVVPFSALIGWHGAVTPRILGLPEDEEGAVIPAVELTGTGRALLYR